MEDIIQIQVVFFIAIIGFVAFFFFILEDRIYELHKEIEKLNSKINELLNKK